MCGLDEKFNYEKMCLACLHLQEGRAKFIATNDDASRKIAKTKLKMPDAGVMVKTLQLALNEREPAQVIGRPHAFTMDLLSQDGHKRENTVMMAFAGNEQSLDAKFAEAAGIKLLAK